MDSDNAQSAGQPPEGTTTTNQSNPQPAVSPAVQSRFDELTGIIHELRRTNETVIQQNLDLAASRIAQQQPEPQSQLPEGVDPTTYHAIMQGIGQQMSFQFGQLKQEMNQMVGGVRQSQEQMEFQREAQGSDPAVVKLALQLQNDWRKKGLNGWTPNDALTHAEGILARQNRQQNRQTRPNGMAEDSVSQGGALPPAINSNRNIPSPKSDEEVRRMSIGQRDEYYLSRVGDSELG